MSGSARQEDELDLTLLRTPGFRAVSCACCSSWDAEWMNPTPSRNGPHSAAQVYEYVFPERAPVQNILDKTAP